MVIGLSSRERTANWSVNAVISNELVHQTLSLTTSRNASMLRRRTSVLTSRVVVDLNPVGTIGRVFQWACYPCNEIQDTNLVLVHVTILTAQSAVSRK